MSLGTTLKKCGCTNPATGHRYHTDCPKLRDRTGRWSSHGSWHFQIELPRRADGFRRPLRHGGYATETEAEGMLTAIGAALAVADNADEPAKVRVGDLI